MIKPFRDRTDAGRQLAEALADYQGQDVIVLGIPRGGVAVAYSIAESLGADLDIIIARKLPLPFNPEAGFGAIAEDGSLVLNEPLVRHVGLSTEGREAIAEQVLAEVHRRVEVYRGERPSPGLKDRIVMLVDDGLATGYTMFAAIQSVNKQSPARVVVAVPCSPASTLRDMQALVDDVVCLRAPAVESFAVASFYQDFHDMSDEEVKALLQQWTVDSEQ